MSAQNLTYYYKIVSFYARERMHSARQRGYGATIERVQTSYKYVLLQFKKNTFNVLS